MPSTAIEWAYWKNNVLSVKYRGGEIYDYLDVPRDIYDALKATRSKGQFVNAEIKPHYAYRRHERPRAH